MRKLMIRCAFAAALAASFLCWVSAAEDAPPNEGKVELLRTGSFHGNEVTAESGETWWALVHTKQGFELRSVSINVEIVQDGIVDEKEEKTGKKVSAVLDDPDNASALLLVKGLPNAAERPVSTVFFGRTVVQPGQSISLGGIPWDAPMNYSAVLSAYGKIVNITGEDSPFVTARGYSLRVRDSSLQRDANPSGQTLFQAPVENWPTDGAEQGPLLLWAGDLDNDGRWDYLMDLTDHYNVELWTLFLSSIAGEGQVVAKAAVFRTVGC